MEKVKIMVACHKPGPVYHDEIYTPVHVGRAISKFTDEMTDMIGDDTGDNISKKNEHYCELTAQYWVWKNYHDVEFIGFCHYRRFFNISITKNNVHSLFRDTDVIMVGVKTKEIVERDMVHYITMEDITIFLMVLKSLYPEYEQDTINYFWGNHLYHKNMLICRKELFDQYAEWLFGILTECEKYIRLSPYARARRVFGYLGEFFMPIFFIHNKCRIKNVKSVDNVGEDTTINLKERIADVAKDSLHRLMKPYLKKPISFEDYYLPEVLVGFKQDGIDPRENQ